MQPQNLDEDFVKREAAKTYAIAMDSFVETVVILATTQALKMTRADGAAHVARVKASAEMRRDAAVSLMRDAFGLSGE